MLNDADFIKSWLEGQQFVGGRLRCDCPLCGGKNTFSATQSSGGYFYICFRASCAASGKIAGRMEASFIKDFLGRKTVNEKAFEIPNHFRSVDGNLRCIDYIVRNHMVSAYKDGRVQLRYDPQQDRIVFLIGSKGVCNGATGRSLDSHISPKWYRYDSGSCSSFICNRDNDTRTRDCVVVEDCASACAASVVLDGIALLGTNLLDSSIRDLAPYDAVYIALDRDASKKAIHFHRSLTFFVNEPIVRFLDKDLKFCTKEEIEGILYGADEHLDSYRGL